MANAIVPYGTTQPPALNLYQSATSEAEHSLKRLYLGLLPPQQIIEICLTFEVHVPFHVRASIWPTDLKAAIAAMQRQPQHPLTNTPNLSNGTEFKAPFTANPPSVPLTHGSQPPSKPLETTSPAPKQTVAAPGQSSTPTQTVTTAPLVNCPITQPPYPHQPYGFPHQQASYPHAPYYSTTPTSYDYPHSSYPPYPPTNYPQSSKTSFAPPSQSVEAQLSAEDLPSYEDIIVEALMGCPDPEGSVPKNIFTWMSSHYPLQSNFRPSASQALQKAYKRGRFEKSSNGKYRLNPLWEGGSTTRRHARRPLVKEQNQTPTSSTSADKAPKASPFTRAPLENKRVTPSGSISAGNVPYSEGQPYTYPPPIHYPSYPSGYSQDGREAAAATTEDTGEGSDAWEAAQNILRAINFGSLIQIDQEDTSGASVSDNSGAINDMGRDGTAQSLLGVVKADVRLPGSGTSRISIEAGAQNRAALQAQIALLAAQMAELADGGQDAPADALGAARAVIPMTRVTKAKGPDSQVEEKDG